MLDCLLFKPKANHYIRNNFYRLSPFKLFALVDNKNEVFGLCFFGESNPIYVVKKDCDNQHYINMIGKSKFDKMSDDDHYGIFLFNDIFHLDKFGKSFKDWHPLNKYFIFLTFVIFHFEISGKKIKELQSLNIFLISVTL